jgi:hypothetical protein
MKTYQMMVNLTVDEEKAAREKVISHLAEKPDADDKPLPLKACVIYEASGRYADVAL